MRIYLAGAIFGCDDSECKDWRETVKTALKDFEILDPMDRDYRSSESSNYQLIVTGDKEAIDNCDILLVNFQRPSVGTSMEILYAWERKKHVLIVAKSRELSPWLLYHSERVLNSLDEAVDYIRKTVKE